uniref:Uncharacterized protein n=1 Tax=Daphnia galeata TaxID=27404 RepID=A0A8J2RZA9_9CRUS|nr:unnamed protein product [Daphnia galeata]
MSRNLIIFTLVVVVFAMALITMAEGGRERRNIFGLFNGLFGGHHHHHHHHHHDHHGFGGHGFGGHRGFGGHHGGFGGHHNHQGFGFF